MCSGRSFVFGRGSFPSTSPLFTRSQVGTTRPLVIPEGLSIKNPNDSIGNFCTLPVLIYLSWLSCVLPFCFNFQHAAQTSIPPAGFFFVLSLYFIRNSLSWCLPIVFNVQNTQHKYLCPPAGFELAIPASKRPQTLALDRSATEISRKCNQRPFGL